MKLNAIVVAGLLASIATSAHASALSETGQTGSNVEKEAAAFRKQHAENEKALSAAMTIDAKRAPGYISEAIAARASELGAKTRGQLRLDIAQHENAVESDFLENHRTCDQRISQAIAHYAAVQQRTVADMMEIHAVQLQLAKDVYAKVQATNGQSPSLLASLRADYALALAVRKRFNGFNAETDVESSLKQADARGVEAAVGDLIKETNDHIRRLAAAKGLQPQSYYKEIRNELRFETAQPVWTTCTPLYESKGAPEPGYPSNNPLMYQSCISIGLFSGEVAGSSLKGALAQTSLLQSSPAVSLPEASYVTGEAKACVTLAASRQVFAEKP